jgi:ubiquinone/menaquinone biosynthesis C-methylase UbiE
MGKLINLITNTHENNKRNYFDRMFNSKVRSMKIARKFDKHFWDGKRRYGYGGYKYVRNYWKPLAKKLIKEYKLNNKSSILDIGCGKAFLLYEILLLLPNIKIRGFDVSSYAIQNAKKELKKKLFKYDVKKKLPFKNKEFDLVISINTFHNLHIYDLKNALREMERVGRKKYLVIEGYRNIKELFNLQCWALTANAFFSNQEWKWIFKNFKYSGDYEIIYFK